jgi:hypothetical protein
MEKFMGFRELKISNITFISVLFAIITISDIWFLSANVLSLNTHILYSFILCICAFLLYIYLKKLSRNQSKIFLIGLIYFIFQTVNGLFNNAENLANISVFIMISFSLYVLLILRNLSNDILFQIIKKTTFYTIFLLIFFDLLNHIIGGNSLFLIFQNNSPTVLMTLIILHYYSNNKKEKSFIIKILFLYIFWTFTSYSLGNGYLRIQYKALILLSIIIISLFFVIKIKFFVPYLNKKLFLRYIVPVIYLFILFLLFGSMSYIYDYIIEFIPRKGSGEIRMAVAEVMFSDVTTSVYNTIFGFGFGSSNHIFSINGVHEASPHSGLMILFYEQGLFGVFLLTFIGLSFFIRKKIYLTKEKIKRGDAFLFLLILSFLWIVQNIVYILGFPAPVVYHQALIFSYLFLATFLSNQLFTPKEE